MNTAGSQAGSETEVAPVLSARNLKVTAAGRRILNIEALIINEGEVFSLVGPNGAGKSTLLTALCMLIRPLSGTLYFKGRKVGEDIPAGDYRKRIAMVFQEPLLFNATVFENVSSGLKFRKMKRSQIERIADENLERFGITHLKSRSAKNISGGEAQRVSLARAFAIDPDILFLDEPFSALDPPTRESLISDFEGILGKSRTTTLLATHDRIEAVRLSDTIAVMNEGRIVQAGRPDELINYPADEFVASFVGIETILKGSVAERSEGSISVDVSGRRIEAIGNYLPGENVILCIRPENVTVSANHSDVHTSARNNFTGVIRKVRPLGLFYRVDMDCGYPLVAYVTRHSMDEMSLCAGKEIEASFKATAVHVLKAKS